MLELKHHHRRKGEKPCQARLHISLGSGASRCNIWLNSLPVGLNFNFRFRHIFYFNKQKKNRKGTKSKFKKLNAKFMMQKSYPDIPICLLVFQPLPAPGTAGSWTPIFPNQSTQKNHNLSPVTELIDDTQFLFLHPAESTKAIAIKMKFSCSSWLLGLELQRKQHILKALTKSLSNAYRINLEWYQCASP